METTMTTEKKPEYSPGLAGVIAGESSICWVDPNAGLMYRGYDAHDLAVNGSFEEVAYLLLQGKLPTLDELGAFNRELAKERAMPPSVLKMMALMPKESHPMDMLRTAVSMLGPFDIDLNDNSHEANLRKATRLVAKVSTLITSGWRIAHGEEVVAPQSDLTHAGNFLHCLTGE